jgi:hypothetical protein
MPLSVSGHYMLPPIADRRGVLQRLRTLWLGLACEPSMAQHPDMQESIAALRRLHEITVAMATLH